MTVAPLLRRLILWLLPCCLAASLLLAMTTVRQAAELERAEELLVAGEMTAARPLLQRAAESWLYGSRGRMGLEIVEALDEPSGDGLSGDGPSGGEREGSVDADSFALDLMVRSAFERGQFEAALRLDTLAKNLGQPRVPLLAAAALIETGRDAEAAVGEATAPVETSRLAERVNDHLARPACGDDVLLYDRHGTPIGRLIDGRLEVAKGVAPEWLPADLATRLSLPEDAGSIRLSLDLELSRAALESFGRFRGSIVLVDPYNGEILTALSDRRSYRSETRAPAFEQLREPASIAKLVTVTAYQRAGLDPDADLSRMQCRGHEVYAGQRLYCPHIAGRLRGLDRAMAISCNVAFANLGVRLGSERMADEFRRFGFGRDLAGFTGGKLLRRWHNDRQLADLSIGLEESAVTPLHAALLAAVMANDGVMPSPTLLHSVDGRLGLHPRRLPTQPGRPTVDKAWLPEVLGSMRAVTRRGTAMRFQARGFPVAMKTGTASHPQHGFHVNYIGVGPLPEPHLAFSVRITHQRTSRKVRRAASEVTGSLLRKLRRISYRRGWQDPAPHRRTTRLVSRQTDADRTVQASRR